MIDDTMLIEIETLLQIANPTVAAAVLLSSLARVGELAKAGHDGIAVRLRGLGAMPELDASVKLGIGSVTAALKSERESSGS